MSCIGSINFKQDAYQVRVQQHDSGLPCDVLHVASMNEIQLDCRDLITREQKNKPAIEHGVSGTSRTPASPAKVYTAQKMTNESYTQQETDKNHKDV